MTKPAPRDHQPGYEAVLLRASIRAQLRTFRRTHFGGDSHIERCMVSAAIQMVMASTALQEQLLACMADAVQTDVRLSLDYKRQTATVFPMEPLANGGR